MSDNETNTSESVPTYTAGIVIGSILLLVLLEVIFRGVD
jgi:hypothetical protein